MAANLQDKIKTFVMRNFVQAISHRRTIYSLGPHSDTPTQKIIQMLDTALLNIPSAFNAQSTRLVLLMGKHHLRLWEIVKQRLAEIVAPEAFGRTREKIDSCFAAGCGTILFYEDTQVVERQKREYEVYASALDEYSSQTSAMHQLAVWTMLADMGFGASLQHYNPLIDHLLAREWHLPEWWRLKAQMPFGEPLRQPDEKIQHLPVEARRMIFL